MPLYRSCNVCGHCSPSLLYRKEGFAVVRCPACSLVFVGDPLEDIDFSGLYDASYYRSADARLYADYFGEETGRRAAARRNLRLLRLFARRGRILDVGCAAGFFLAEAKQYFEPFGVEFSPVSSAFARERFGLDVRTGTLAESGFSDGFFNVVTLWDVIEHVPDPAALLGEVFRVLRPGGLAVLTTGDIESPFARRAGSEWPLMTPPWHLYFFNRKTILGISEATGFRPVFLFTRGAVSGNALFRNPVARFLGNVFQRGDVLQIFLRK